MCGIFGYYDFGKKTMAPDKLAQMGAEIRHRGPDGYGCYHDDSAAVGLGNQRLAILDIDNGQQPFFSDDESIIVVQNGEIFNHVELAEELTADGYPCKTTCDTEVILRLYERDGIDGVSKLNGMFAIAVYDKRIDALFLIRDRIGEKPLYFSNEEGRVIFASEIKSILPSCGKRKVDFQALNQFLAFNYVPPPLTMFEGIQHVLPGHWLKITRQGIEESCWWDLSQVTSEKHSEEEWIARFNDVLDDAVRIRLRSDVPFGAFLSGGVDSSTVVGIMSRHLESPVKSFCIGFDDPKYDESPYAQDAADRFETEHVMQKVEPNLIGLWPMATRHCDQPHGDVSFLPTYKVASLAAEQVKMVLTGDGADELFAGYDKYRHFFTSQTDALLDEQFQKDYLDNISLFTKEARLQLFSEKLKNELGEVDVFDVVEPLFEKAVDMDRINQALYIDMMLLLPGNNLVKPDRMGMAVSLENRAPFLDYRMMELAFAMPGNLKLNDGVTKFIYKKAVTPLIGEELAYRKKQMFTVPIGEWFKTDLADMCNDLLCSDQTTSRGLFDYDYVATMLEDHCNGTANYTREIRALMAFEIWLREFSDYLFTEEEA
ncbi:asparagine synthase (glutamine-hydrolyzing) [Halodesulfovibrio sp.]|jgi:asparagine synthase (glutamine-hydrolysing)|uniref:asparagine synthase (glutamine-hydrolyzing) n=1 Tax=Halodesulfovibrio sp. TaxID=1912772 RepID=UPI0025D66E7B|nr:asparagine synthase (glutamine-hydrolyzing) [Halodesulfovibrio sp.]MCT4626538.1 asparagine synthase (glutamine-hydrolyzing) [Halodesulfovibrio sp.]